jgi:CO/xanthine dehydrogenase Mo-binding subunit
VPATFVIETVMNHVAKALNKSPDEIREINFYKKGQVKVLINFCNIVIMRTDRYSLQLEVHARSNSSPIFNKLI